MQKRALIAVVILLSALRLAVAQKPITSAEAVGRSVRTAGAPIVLGDAMKLITFEGLMDQSPVGNIRAATFESGWLALVDSDAGGTGNIANEPSGETVAFVPEGSGTPDVTFATPVGSVSFKYALGWLSPTPVVTFRDADGVVLGTSTMDECGSPFCGVFCPGDPEGTLCHWPSISFTVSNPPGISSLTVEGGNDVWVIDDFWYDTNILPVELQSFTIE